jgi:hypothetical protein
MAVLLMVGGWMNEGTKSERMNGGGGWIDGWMKEGKKDR